MSDSPGGRREIIWAPWRMDYVGREHDEGFDGPRCVFCRLPRGGDDAAAYILHRGERAFVIMNLYPYNNGHLMVVPFAHTDNLVDLDATTLAEMTALLQEAQRILTDTMRPHGFNMGINQGAAAGAGVAEHIHWHLVPRWAGDTNFMPVLGDTRVMPQHLDETYRLLKERYDSA